MAQKRMFSKTIIDSDAFLDMPHSTQLLYFHLNMRADDDGFINNCKNIMRMIACKEDDLKILITKKFVIPFESGVIVIKHWRIHNYIQNDRYTETKYKEEKSLLSLDENKSYTLKEGQCIQNGYSLDTQNKSKNKILDINNIYGQNEGKNIGQNIDQKEEWETQFEKFYKEYPKKVKKQDVKKWFKKNRPSSKLFSSMINRLEQFKTSNDWQKDGGQYIPYPTTWLNQKRWEDESIQVEIANRTKNVSNFTQRKYSEEKLQSLYANKRRIKIWKI